MSNRIAAVSSSQGRSVQTARHIIHITNLFVYLGLVIAACHLLRLPSVHASGRERNRTQNVENDNLLSLGKPIERELAGSQSHFYAITMATGQYLKVKVEQRGIDVLAALFAPDGKSLIEVNSTYVIEGTETFSAIAAAAGTYKIEIRSSVKTAKPGRYEIKVEELREASANDKYRVAAESISREAEPLKSGTAEAKRRGLEKYQEALELYRKGGDRKGEAETLSNIGVIHWFLGDMRKASEMFNEVLPLKRTVGDRNGEAAILNNIGLIYRSLGEMQKALEKYDEALPIFQAVGNRNGEAITLSNLGDVYWSQGKMKKALEKFNEALPILQAIGDRKSEAVIHNNIGLVYRSRGEMQKALDKYNEALPIFQAAGDRKGEAVTFNNIGLASWSLGEFQKALEKFNETLSLDRALGDRNGEAAALNNIGLVYRSLGEMQKALEKFNEALPLKRAVGDRNGEAITLQNIGLIYRSLGEMQKALEKFNEALPIFQAIGDRNGGAITLSNVGDVYSSLGEVQKAMEKYNEALPILQTVGDRDGEAETLNSIGLAYRSMGEMQKALEKFNEALPLRRAVGDRNGEAATLLVIGLVEKSLGNLALAGQTIEQAIAIVESTRADFTSQELRTSYFASRRKFYESYIDVLMEQHLQNPAAASNSAAFAISERARARSMLDLLRESRADIHQGVDRSLLERERSLQQLLNAKAAIQTRLLNRKHTPEQADAAAKEINSITTEYEEIRAQIRAKSPRYAALTQPQPLSLKEVQQQVLDDDTLLLEYWLGERASYLFVVCRDSITSYHLPKRAEIEAVARRVRNLLIAPQPLPGEAAVEYLARVKEAGKSYWPEAAALSRLLLGPAAAQLGAKRLLIVADGALQYIPFGALPVPDSEASAPSSLRVAPTPLIVDHEIVHLPSASVLAVMRRELAGRQLVAKTVAVLADPVFSADDARVKTGAKVQIGKVNASDLVRAVGDVRGELRRLVLTRDEAEAILSITPRTAGLEALDFRANRAVATSSELSQYRIVHFATHGLLDSEHPDLSGLVLSLVDERGQPQDGFLRLNEIFNLRLPADLVVLSACQTGLGKEIKSEGLIGLTRGFMYAGAARVVASLWQVNDAATAELMKRFYRRMLRDGMRPAAALRAAQIEMLEKPQWHSPFYWSGFVLQGEWK